MSDLLISPRWFSPGSENGMIRKGICRPGCIEVREKNAAASTADFPRRGDGDQQPDRGTNGGGQGVLSPRSPAGVPARGARRAEFPYVHQPDDRRWDRETKLISGFCRLARLARWWVGVGRSLAAFRAEQILQGSDDGAAFFLGRRLNDTGEPCEGLRTTLILGTMGKLAHNHRRSQGPLPTVVRRFDGRVVQEQQHSPSIMLQTDSVQ